MCSRTALDVITQHFGFQRAMYDTGLTNAQKSLNGFDTAVYYPTNWRNGEVKPQRGKTPEYIRYGGLVPVNPEWIQKNYLGAYSLKEQPTIDNPQAFTMSRFS